MLKIHDNLENGKELSKISSFLTKKFMEFLEKIF